MTTIARIYTPGNCHAAYQLLWSVTLFWRSSRIETDWFTRLTRECEKDDIRLLQHKNSGEKITLFLVSTTPKTTIPQILRSVKGRLQNSIRSYCPKAFQRNYSIHSVGSVKRKIVEQYVSSQLDHHQMADSFLQRKLKRYQIRNPEIDLSQVRYSSHGQYIYNLHLVIVNEGRFVLHKEDDLFVLRNKIIQISQDRKHLLSNAGIFTDHFHLTVGCNLHESPEQLALTYLNGLSHAFGMKAIFQRGYSVRTFGEYDLGAIH